jgi:hypothetical protein
METLPNELQAYIGGFMDLPALVNMTLAYKDQPIGSIYRSCTHKAFLAEQKNAKTYQTRDKGRRPFRVRIGKNSAYIEELTPAWQERRYSKMTEEGMVEIISKYKTDKYKWFKNMVFNQAFIGTYQPRIPMYNPAFYEGNSILLHLTDKEYMYIGSVIYKFRSLAQIVKYFSPVCSSSDYNYPYAIDAEGRYYLMVDKCILETVPDDVADLYAYLYFSPERDQTKESPMEIF